jgi:hypothetical protein
VERGKNSYSKKNIYRDAAVLVTTNTKEKVKAIPPSSLASKRMIDFVHHTTPWQQNNSSPIHFKFPIQHNCEPLAYRFKNHDPDTYKELKKTSEYFLAGRNFICQATMKKHPGTSLP